MTNPPNSAGADPALTAIDHFIREQSVDTSDPGWKLRLSESPSLSFAAETRYLWSLETSHGSVVIRLMHDVAPKHASSTLYLTRLGFYDELPFHRVIPEFMAQGGDPRGNGTGGPGYEYDGEFDPEVKHDRPGLLSMANSGPGTDGSQFFLTFVPVPWLDGKHTIFGEVVEGMETVRELEKRGTQGGQTTEPLSIRRATVRIE